MNFEIFSKLWDALVTNRPAAVPAADASAPQITNGMSEGTAQALIEYANGNKTRIESVRAHLAQAAA